MGADMKKLKNQKGFSSIEATVLMVTFVVVIYYTFGFFGIVHTAVLHNIHARTYAFETFRHRHNLMYFREARGVVRQYYNIGTRLHGINTDADTGSDGQIATERPISMGLELDEHGRDPATHNRRIQERIRVNERNSSIAANPVWIMVLYGICLNENCGGG